MQHRSDSYLVQGNGIQISNNKHVKFTKNKIHMKQLLLFILGSLIFFPSFAQSNKEDIDMIQAMYGKEKKSIAADFIVLPDNKKDAFWKIYDDYEAERKDLGKKRINLIEKYANAYDTLTDKSTDAIIKETIAMQKSTDALISKYYDKISKSVGVRPAAQFYQLEYYLLSMVRTEILTQIPFIGELGKKASSEKQ